MALGVHLSEEMVLPMQQQRRRVQQIPALVAAVAVLFALVAVLVNRVEPEVPVSSSSNT
jgi:hypothetical protein